jgi:hypothetical protein
MKHPALAIILFMVLLGSAGAQEGAEPTSTPTPYWVTPPTMPVKGPIVRRRPGQPGLTPGVDPNGEKSMSGITIDGFPFMMESGPCARKVSAAIMAHDDLFTGDKVCDGWIRKARDIQRQHEIEDPSYAIEPRITPAPTPTDDEADQ